MGIRLTPLFLVGVVGVDGGAFDPENRCALVNGASRQAVAIGFSRGPYRADSEAGRRTSTRAGKLGSPSVPASVFEVCNSICHVGPPPSDRADHCSSATDKDVLVWPDAFLFVL